MTVNNPRFFQLRCNHYPQQSKESKAKYSIPDEFTKDNIAPFTKNNRLLKVNMLGIDLIIRKLKVIIGLTFRRNHQPIAD